MKCHMGAIAITLILEDSDFRGERGQKAYSE